MVKIGLEIHGYINTKEKLFCDCKISHGKKHAEPNTNICPICTAQPGSKPLAPNEEAIEKAIQISLILGCKVSKKISWQRKHYSWPDLPKGFQTTISGSHATPNGIQGKFEEIRITECHLEEDPAAWNPETGEIDYNRSGSPLIEIVTEPDFKSKEQVIGWLQNLLATLSYIKAIDKKSGIKADVNISINDGKRVELKNINSLRKIKQAIEIETERQEKNPPQIQQTRTYVEDEKTTKLMRTKENAQDYRFIVDPDLPLIKINEQIVKKIKKELPETPKEKLNKLIKKHKIDKTSARVLTKKLSLVELFEKTINKIKPELAISWTTTELLGAANKNKVDIDDLDIKPEHFIELLEAIQKQKITELKAKQILKKWVHKSYSPKEYIQKSKTISGDEIEKISKQVISENEKAIEDYNSGKENAINYLIGQVMRKTNKRADFKYAKEILKKQLKKTT
jgi:aspartyl-tRNA(Asn)/glutamyl-tRNA(Gln) amidotransferase subunit B